MMLRRQALLRLAAAGGAWSAMSGCSVPVNSAAFIRPQPAPPIDRGALGAALPAGFQVADDHIPFAQGRLYRVRVAHPMARATLVFFGGNGWVMQRALPAFVALASAGPLNIVMADHPGYGQSTGPASVAGFVDASLALWDGEAAAPGRTLLVGGFSLGGVMAAQVMRQRRPAGAILMATVSSARRHVALATPWWMRALSRPQLAADIDAIDNIPAVAAFEPPLWVVGAGADQVVPVQMSRELFAAAARAPQHKRLTVIDGAAHNDVLAHPQFRDGFARFLADNGWTR